MKRLSSYVRDYVSSKRLSELVREPRIRIVDQHATPAHILLNIPNLWNVLTVWLAGLGGCEDGGVGKGIRKDFYLSFQKPFIFSFSELKFLQGNGI